MGKGNDNTRLNRRLVTYSHFAPATVAVLHQQPSSKNFGVSYWCIKIKKIATIFNPTKTFAHPAFYRIFARVL